jgi:PHD/YefM family antitoxin component YafN of YafNO toxin-antitoxin module
MEKVYTASKARENLYKLLDFTAEAHQPVRITGKRHNAVMISEEDYNSMVETLYITSIKGLKDKILKASKEPKKNLKTKISWE